MALWLLTLFCAIIQNKIISGKTWGAYMNQQIDHFSNVFTAIRRFLLGAERFILLKELQDYWSRKKKKEQRKAPTQKKIGAFRVIDRFSYKR
jgi:high-affinity Fe2+/Pb2+ permease